MRIVTVHNFYKLPGGEDVVFEQESSLLEARGHAVTRYVLRNDDVDGLSSLALAGRTVWSGPSYRALRVLFRQTQADIAHFHNTMPLVSPAAYYAAAAENVAVVQTLHNYRLLCPGNNLFRDGGPCELCVDRDVPWPAVRYACYRDSRLASLGVATMLTLHRALGTWRDRVHAFVCLTEFARRKFVEGGLPEQRLFIKRHFIDPDPGPGKGAGGYALFVGRLEEGKGVRTLLNCWQGDISLRLVIAGKGPLEAEVQEAARSRANIDYVGWVRPEQVATLLQGAAVQVFPSLFYEGLPTSLIQSFAVGTPVVATDSPNLAALIKHGETGLLFPAKDPMAMRRCIDWFAAQPAAAAAMRLRCREEYIDKYTSEQSYAEHMKIYEHALATAREGRASAMDVAV